MKSMLHYRTSEREQFQGRPLDLGFQVHIEARMHKAEH